MRHHNKTPNKPTKHTTRAITCGTDSEQGAAIVHQIMLHLEAFLAKPTHRAKAKLDVVLYDYLLGVIRRQAQPTGVTRH